MARRGFNEYPLESESFFHNDELKDFVFMVNKLKKDFKCKVFMVGVSAGSCYGARMLGKYSEEMNVDGFCSIGNPFNFSQVCYHMEKSFFGRIISKVMVKNTSTLMNHHINNPYFVSKLIKSNYRLDDFHKDYQSVQTMYEYDQKIVAKIQKLRHPIEV